MRDGWVETTLGEVALLNPSEPALSNTDHFAPMDAVHVGKRWLQYTEERRDRSGARARAGDVLFARITPCLENGKVAQVQSELERCGGSTEFIVVRGTEKCTSDFLYFWCTLKVNRDKAAELMTGTTGRQRLSRQDLGRLSLWLPPLPEQKRIVDLISSVDSYIKALEQQLASARSASNAQLEKIISEFNDDWVEVTLGEVLEISRGGSPRPIQEYLTDSEDGINWVKIADATRSEKYIYSTLQKIKKEGISRSREVFSGDFILSNSMSFGRPYIMRTDGCIHDGWLLLSKVSNRFDEDFLYNLLNSDYVQRQFESLAAGSGVRNLNIEVVKKVKVKIPTIEVQRELASIINEFDNFIIKLTRQLHSGMDLRQALLSDLLSGTHEIPVTYDKVMGAA